MYITFSVPIQKEVSNDMALTNKIKFIERIRFMASSLSNLVDNLVQGIRKGECRDSKWCVEYANVKDGLLIFNCSDCKKKIMKKNLTRI